jgi:UDP-galactopyranose mutase
MDPTPLHAAAAPREALLPDIVCFSHRAWTPDFQRAHRLLARFAHERRVFFVEPPRVGGSTARLRVELSDEGVWVAHTQLPEGLGPQAQLALQRELLDGLLVERRVHRCVLWYYTPLALPYTRHLRPRLVVYDCTDELAGLSGPTVGRLEAELLGRADLVLTASEALHQSRRERHRNVHAVLDGSDDAESWELSWARARLLVERATAAPLATPRSWVG